MKTIRFLFLVFSFAIGLALPVSAQLQEGSRNFSRAVQWAALQSTVKVSKGQAIGSGTIVGKDRYSVWILTAAHVVDNSGKLRITYYWWDGQNRPSGNAEKSVVAIDKTGDCALIRMQRIGQCPPARPICPVSQRMNPDRLPVLSVGGDGGGNPDCWTAWSYGHGFRHTNYSSSVFTIVGREPIGGRSGGPLFDTRGYVIGVCVASGGGEGMFATLNNIHRVCDKANASWLYGSSRPIRPLPQRYKPSRPLPIIWEPIYVEPFC